MGGKNAGRGARHPLKAGRHRDQPKRQGGAAAEDQGARLVREGRIGQHRTAAGGRASCDRGRGCARRGGAVRVGDGE